jgi:regulator of replication initiation timing
MPTATRVEIEPIDRLGEKIRRLVELVERLRADVAEAAAENQRLTMETDALRARLAAGDSIASELSAMRKERDVIRTRVGDMLEELEALNL